MAAIAEFPKTARGAAKRYLSLGFLPIPVPHRSKNPALAGWPSLRLSLETLDAHFPKDTPLNVSLLTGEPSGLVDIDLDSPQAIKAGQALLPDTGMISGHRSKPRSHFWYLVREPPNRAREAYHDLEGGTIAELRSNKSCTVVPPSVHEESGETIGWSKFDGPAQVDLTDLQAAVAWAERCPTATHGTVEVRPLWAEV